MNKTCIYPGCLSNASLNGHGQPTTDGRWCSRHFGLYPHNCEEPGCTARPVYDDEPKCFTHSPDMGSSVRGYSAYEKTLKQMPDVRVLDDVQIHSISLDIDPINPYTGVEKLDT
jgi:hypothetical protein